VLELLAQSPLSEIAQMAAPAGAVTFAPTDMVGYGKWGDLTYQELWDQQAEYCLWTVNKFKELVKDGEELETRYVEGESKMKRVAQWIMETDEARAAIEPEYECDSDMEMVEVERPESETLDKRVAKLRAEKEASSVKFYGVAAPEEHKGVYTSWAECRPHVVGIKGAKYKSFPTEEEADEYVRNPPLRKSETAEAIAAREEARKAKEEAKAAKVAEAQAAKAAKDEAKAAKAAEAKAAKEAKAAEGKAPKRKSGGGSAPEGEKPKRGRKSVSQETVATAAVAQDEEPELAKKALETEPAVTKKAKKTKTEGEQVVEEEESVPAKKARKTKKDAQEAVQEDASAKATKSGIAITAEVLKRSQELGMTGALNNLAARPEIISKGVSSQDLLDALVKAEGLVNKAKNALLAASPAVDPISPAKDARVDRMSLPISPEKVPNEKLEKPEHEELAKTLSNLSTTLRLVTEAPAETAAKASVTDEQAERIKENRERALARKAQLGGN